MVKLVFKPPLETAQSVPTVCSVGEDKVDVGTPRGGGFEYLHRLRVVRSDEGGTVSDGTVMCGYWSSVT
jgi:hypothetical protein